MTTKITIKDCGADCGCHDDNMKEVGNNVWMNTKGSSGPSEKMLKMLAMKKAREENKSK